MKHHKRALITGIILTTVGLFILTVLSGFSPDDSLHFTDTVSGDISHFLGRPGSAVSSFLLYLAGRASWLFCFLLMYLGYSFMRRIRLFRKVIYCVLAASAVTLSMVVLQAGDGELYRSGGIFGRTMAESMPGRIAFPAAGVLLAGALAGLFWEPVSSAVKGLKSYAGKTSFGRNKEKETDERKIERETDISKKLPLLRRVYYGGEEPETPEPMNDEPPGPEDRGRVEKTAQPRIKPVPGHKPEPKMKEVGPNITLLNRSETGNRKEKEKETQKKAHELERTLNEFGIDAHVTGIIRGPVITRYELQPAPGVKLNRIVNLSNNIALNLSANGVRIEAPIPGRAAVGIEIPNDEREVVTLGDIIQNAERQGELPLILGKDISGETVVSDLTLMPHLLIAGATGSGKSVCVNSLIVSLLFRKSPEEVRFLMIDPKMVELKIYNGIAHLLTEVVTDPRDAAKALRWVIYEMENRYKLLDENYVRNITGYNKKASNKLPYIIVIVDEFANLMSISQKEVEDAVVRLAAMSRAVGIHLIMATQRPSVDVITGLIKANFPYRIAFQVASKTDSRTILDSIGAEKLLGRGDMLFAPAGSMNIQRIQGAFISEGEVINIVEDLKKKHTPEYRDDIFSLEEGQGFDTDYEDPMLEQAMEIVIKTKRASASFLQRRLKIGYNRAARIIEIMEDRGIIGPPRGSKPREIYMDQDQH